MEGGNVCILLCRYCDFQCLDHKSLLKHTRAIHENDPDFKIYCSLCGRSFQKWCSLKKHLHRDHTGNIKCYVHDL